MGKRTSYAPGTFSWVDLATTDPEAAKRFYGALLGWSAEDAPAGGGATYSTWRVDGDAVGGLYEQRPEQRAAGAPPAWLSYVTVASADDAAARAGELGGEVHAGPFDVMTAGRMAVIADPVGAFLAVWEPRDNVGATRVNDPGCLTWNDLATSGPEASEAFYAALFGWRFDAVDTGGGPRYWTIAHDGAAQGRNGGMRELSPGEAGVPPHWMPYFTVESVEATVEGAQAAGGELLAGPMDLPTGRIAALRDPQGAAFAVFAGDVDD